MAPRVPDSTENLLEQVATIKALLIDVNMREAQLHASGLHEKFNALIEFVDSGDFAPAQQALEVYADLVADLDGLTNRFNSLVVDHLPQLSTLIGQSLALEVRVPA